MARSEQDVMLAAKLYECRKAARFLLGETYEATLLPYKDAIADVMRRRGLSEIQAALRLGERVHGSKPGTVMFLMAAAVEMIEKGAAA